MKNIYGVRFGDKHSIYDWNLVAKSCFTISPPEPKNIYIDIPEADGQLDLTESISGEVKYKNRKITCEFLVTDAMERWAHIYSEVANYLHGKQMKVVFDDDVNHYYYGILAVDQWKSDKGAATLVIVGIVEPYKYDVKNSIDSWLWDDFNFENDAIREFKDIYVNPAKTVQIYGSRKTVVPEFIVSSMHESVGLKVWFEDHEYKLKKGTNRILDIRIKEGQNIVVFYGLGTVSIKYQGGSL